jgi:hypothetical protein
MPLRGSLDSDAPGAAKPSIVRASARREKRRDDTMTTKAALAEVQALMNARFDAAADNRVRLARYATTLETLVITLIDDDAHAAMAASILRNTPHPAVALLAACDPDA